MAGRATGKTAKKGIAGMKVLFVSMEVAPFAWTGGMGDVAGSLPKALRELGVDDDVRAT